MGKMYYIVTYRSLLYYLYLYLKEFVMTKLVRIVLYVVTVVAWFALIGAFSNVKIFPIVDILVYVGVCFGGFLCAIWVCAQIAKIGRGDEYWFCDTCKQSQPIFNPNSKVTRCPRCHVPMKRTFNS